MFQGVVSERTDGYYGSIGKIVRIRAGDIPRPLHHNREGAAPYAPRYGAE